MEMAERLTIWTGDNNAQTWQLQDATGLRIATTENGFSMASWKLHREFGVAWPDVGLNYFVTIYGPRGFDIAWQGRIESVEPTYNNGVAALSCSATGFWASLGDEYYYGTLGTSTTPEALLQTAIGLMANIAINYTGLTVTGVTGIDYRTGNWGTDDETWSEIVQKICDFGTNILTQRVVPAVWDNRILSTSIVTTVNATPDYIVSRQHIVSTGLRRSLSSVKNRVTVRYNNGGDLTRSTVNDTTGQAALATAYPVAGLLGLRTNFIRTRIADYTGLGTNLSSSTVSDRANILLNNSKRVKTDAQSIVVKADYVILDNVSKQEIPLWRFRAGKWLNIVDLFPRLTRTGSGASNADAGITTTFYIVGTEYDAESGSLTLTPESSSNLADLVA